MSVIDALPYLEGELTAAPSMVDRWSDIGNNHPFPTVTSQSPKQIRVVLPIQRKVGVLKSNGRILQPLWRELAEPVNTITSLTPTIGSLPIETTREAPIKAVKIRSLTLQETAILQGFSSSMKIPYARKKDAWTVIGNAVCPPVAEAVIRGLL